MSRITSICVYCASGPGTNPAFVQTAKDFGRVLAENDIRLVYGGGAVGLMGALANSVLDFGGTVTGVIPEFLTNREHMMLRAQERIVTRDMHERKRIMFERADAFVALPGGVGTLEELVEQITWAQLGRHKKPILIANTEHFWDPLCTLLEHMRPGRVHPARAIRRGPDRRPRRGYPAEADRRRTRGIGSRDGDVPGHRRAAVAHQPLSFLRACRVSMSLPSPHPEERRVATRLEAWRRAPVMRAMLRDAIFDRSSSA